MERNTDRGCSRGLTVQATLANSSITTSVDKVNTSGAIKGDTKEAGKKTRCMAVEHSRGPTGAHTMVITLRIRRKVKECSDGQMDESMTDHGKMANSMG